MNRIKIYTRNGCSKCDKAKALLERFEIPYTEYEIDQHKERLLKEHKNLKELPVVFNNNILLGGYNDLAVYLEKERLES